jgi:hypothetical protein
MQFRNTCISKSSVFASTECFRFGDMLFTQCSQNGAQTTPAPLKNSHLARPHAGHFFWLLRAPDSKEKWPYLTSMFRVFGSFIDAEQKEWLASHKPKRAKGI